MDTKEFGFNRSDAKLYKNDDGILTLSNGGRVFGYARVSTKEQKEYRQIDALVNYGVDPKHIFVEKISGKTFNRPIYKRMLRLLQAGDILVITSIDRLGRNYQDIQDQWRIIVQDIGAGIHVIEMPILNTSGDPNDLMSRFVTDMILQVLSFVAETEHKNTMARQRAGLDAKMVREDAEGPHVFKPHPREGGPWKRSEIKPEMWEIYVLWRTKACSTKKLMEIAKESMGIAERSVYRRLREIHQRYGDIPVSKLTDYMVDDMLDNGIQFDNERCETALGYYNPYMSNPHEKRRKNHENAKRRLAGEDVPVRSKYDKEAREIQEIVLEKRRKAFRERFGITEDPADLPDVHRGHVNPNKQKNPPPDPTHRTVIVD